MESARQEPTGWSWMLRYLPFALLATIAVVGPPIAIVWALRGSGAIESTLPLMLLGAVLALALAWAGGALWKRRARSAGLVFSELLLWGFARRLYAEWRLSSAAKALAAAPHSGSERDLQMRLEALVGVADALERRDAYTHGHSRRVAIHAANIANRMGLPREEVRRIRRAGVLHDVGKINTPLEVLHKPGRLDAAEWALIKKHPVDGAEMLKDELDKEMLACVLYHHERLDGSGYPEGLSGGQIPIGARIMGVADTYDAITSSRPYRGALPHLKALEVLEQEAGVTLDAEAVRAFRSHYGGGRVAAIWAIALSVPQFVLARVTYRANAASPRAMGGLAAVVAAIALGATAISSGSPPERSQQADAPPRGVAAAKVAVAPAAVPVAVAQTLDPTDEQYGGGTLGLVAGGGPPGVAAGSGGDTTDVASIGELPFTGLDVAAIAAIGIGLVGAGFILRRAARAGDETG